MSKQIKSRLMALVVGTSGALKQASEQSTVDGKRWGRRRTLLLPLFTVYCSLFTSFLAAAPAVEPSFVGKPAIVKEKGGVRIDFTLATPGDVEVGILGADGKVINHLAAGVLGGTYAPPEPFQEGLAQSLLWDGKDDNGNAVDVDTCKVRLRLGLKPTFAWTTGKYPKKPARPDYWIGFKVGANINGPDCNPNHIVTQLPASYTGALVCAYRDPSGWYGDKAMMVPLKQEGDVFFAERDGNSAERKSYLTKFNYTNTGDKVILNCGRSYGGTNASYSIYKAHGKAGDRFYRPSGHGSSDGHLYGFWFADSNILYTPSDDPAVSDPQTDFLIKSHPACGSGSGQPMITDEDKSLDVFYYPRGSWGEGCYSSYDCMDAGTGKKLFAQKLQYNHMAFRKYPNGDAGFGGNSAVFDSKRGYIYLFNEAGSSVPTGEKCRGALLRFSYTNGLPAPWPQTNAYWVAGVCNGDGGSWAGGGKGMALGPDGAIYVNTKSNKMSNKGGPLVVKAIKDGVIVNDRLIRVDAPFCNIKVDRQGNVYVAVFASPKNGSWPEDIDKASLANAQNYANLGAVRQRTGSIFKFSNAGGSVVMVPGASTNYDYVQPTGERLKAEKAPTWAWYGFMNIVGQSTCWCPWGSFDMDGWGRLFVPRTYEAGLVVIDSSRNLVLKLRNRDVTDEQAMPGFGMIPSNIGVTDNSMIVSDVGWTRHGFRLDAKVTSTIDIKTGK